MRAGKRLLAIALTGRLFLSGCAGTQAPMATAPPPQMTQAPTEPTAEPTQAPTETQPVPTGLRSMAQLPAEDTATGMLKFYINGKAVYAGGPVSDLLDANVQTYEDMSALIQPWNISGNTRFRVVLPDTPEADQPFLFITVINAGDEPRPFSDCLIYSVTVSCSEGIAFGSGNEQEPFISMQTTRKEIEAAYGAPDYRGKTQSPYEEIAYYQPFNCAYFSFKRGVVRQIMTYYCAYRYPELAKNPGLELKGYFGSDAWLLMNRYLDVQPYLDGTLKKTVSPALDEFILLDGEKIEFGQTVEQMPEQFAKPFEELTQVIDRNYYLRTGKGNEEEFYLMNRDGMRGNAVKYAVVKGVITQNRYYTSWGFDYSGFHEFEYQGLKSDSTIEDILKLFGAPQELKATSSAKAFYVWMHYQDENKNTLHICIDPMLDEIVELQAVKHFDREQHY